jgi:hypothetical protein
VTDDGLAAEVELLAAENRRLKRKAAVAGRTSYRRTALGLALLGLLAAAGAVAFPGSRTVLAALAGIGLFGAVLTRLVTPERTVSAAASERVYDAYAASATDATADLGLAGAPVYVPVESVGPGFAPVRLYVPRHDDAALPPVESLAAPFVVGEDPDARGVTYAPVGAALVAELRDAALEPVPTDPGELGDYLASALVDAFELAGDARASLDAEGTALVVAVTDPAYGPLSRFDHPVVSLLATGVAAARGVPVRAAVAADGDEWVVDLSWAERRADGPADRAHDGANAAARSP